MRFPAEVGWEKIRNPELYKKKQEQLRQWMQLDSQQRKRLEDGRIELMKQKNLRTGNPANSKKVEVIEEIETSSPDGLSDDEEALLDWSRPSKTKPVKLRLPEPLSAKSEPPPKKKSCSLTYTNYLRELKERPLSELPGSARVLRLVWFRKSANVASLRFEAKFGSYPASLQGKLLQGVATRERGNGLHVRPRVTLTDLRFDELFDQITNSDVWADEKAVIKPTSEIEINSFSNLYDQNSLPMVDKLVVETWSNSKHRIAVPSIIDPSLKDFVTKQLEIAGLTPIDPPVPE